MRQETRQLNRERRRVLVYGIVQGVGFRPFTDRIAKRAEVGGSVCNKGSFVEIYIEGPRQNLDHFIEMLRTEAPARSQILKITQKEEPCRGETVFSILPSKKVEGDVFVSPDIGICDACRKELYDPQDRRYLHPFINCTACGPRLTILDSMPYDRVRTSMGAFPMCEACEAEYTSPKTRRYHAQPVCCNDCGPRLYLLKYTDEEGNVTAQTAEDLAGKPKQKTDLDCLRKARAVIRRGGILAVKGIGGFHLCCDAGNNEAVKRLRELKQRPFKPFALMMKDMDTVRRECVLRDGQQAMLEGPQKPILLLQKRTKAEGARVSALAAPDNPYIGVMLPYAPVQLLLFDDPDDPVLEMTDCLIMTSANPKGAPICRTDEDISGSVGKWCDAVLSTNRVIRSRADDSVMNWADGKPAMIRRSRGFAPVPVMLEHPDEIQRQVLGIGGELKNTFCLAKGEFYYPSAYIGDLTDIRTVSALKETEERMERLLQIQPQQIVCDLHPGYRSSAAAEELGAEKGIPVIRVQHHYAHVLSCMAENQTEEPVIGVSLDGTGYGTDHSIWGGEFLLADARGFTRLGSLGVFPQAGGDLASRQGWRIAAALLKQADPDRFMERSEALHLGEKSELSILSQMIEKGINTVPSSSMGRLFDAASAVLGFRRESTCEGEASMVLQFAAERAEQIWKADVTEPAAQILGWIPEITEELSRDEQTGGGIPLKDWNLNIGAESCGKGHAEKSADESEQNAGTPDPIFRIPADQLLLELAERRLSGEDPDRLALGFHQCVAEMIAAGCEQSRRVCGLQTVCLTGGVLQNQLLSRLTKRKLKEKHFRVLTHSMIPANDGGIALGQAYYGMRALQKKDKQD